MDQVGAFSLSPPLAKNTGRHLFFLPSLPSSTTRLLQYNYVQF